MRRLLTLSIVVGLVLASAAPAGAKVDQQSYDAIECITDFGNPDKIWFTGKDGKVMHMRGVTNTAQELMLNGTAWELVGMNTIEVNYNGAFMIVDTPAGPVPAPTDGTFWGTFDLRLDDIGDFTGHWSWAKGAVDGRGSGSGDGKLSKVDLLGEDLGWPAVPPGCGFVEYIVTTK
ncbi:MAG: hypothetical protein ACR2NL_09640 [Acidimicrobiia bacterium]